MTVWQKRPPDYAPKAAAEGPKQPQYVCVTCRDTGLVEGILPHISGPVACWCRGADYAPKAFGE